MEDISVEGLVLREVRTGESDKILTLLTGAHGKMTVTAKGAASLKSKFFASAQIFTYSSFVIRRKGEFCYVKETSYHESFENIRYDLEKLALANYVCDVASDLAHEELEDEGFLSLVLNTLYAVANRNTKLDLLKGAFEFRAAVHSGFMPELGVCGHCGIPIKEECAMDVMNGRLLCKKCRTLIENDPAYSGEKTAAKIMIRVTPPVLAAMRYIESAPPKKYLSFKLDEAELPLFSVVCERYLLNHLEHGFTSLEYYKKVKM